MTRFQQGGLEIARRVLDEVERFGGKPGLKEGIELVVELMADVEEMHREQSERKRSRK